MNARLLRTGSALLPFLIIGGLLYTALFVKPSAAGRAVAAAPVGPRDVFYDLAVPAPGATWAVGRGGKIARRERDQAGWQLQPSGTTEHLQGIATWDGREAVAVGNAATILRTTDGGTRWQPVALALPDDARPKLLRVRRVGSDGAVAVGEAGLVALSTDRGAHWQAVGRREDVAWNDAAADGSTLLLVGEFGRIQRSEDGGRSWAPVASPVKTSLNAVALRADGRAVAVGVDGVLLLSHDAGRRWTRQDAGTAQHLFDVRAQDDGWIAAADQGQWLRSEDGRRWTVQRLTGRDAAWHTTIATDGPTLLLAGSSVVRLDAAGSPRSQP